MVHSFTIDYAGCTPYTLSTPSNKIISSLVLQ